MVMGDPHSVESRKNLCEICSKNITKYCCPRCNINYCSLHCYRSNSHLQCSESFYKDNVMEEVNLQQKEKREQGIQEILQISHSGNVLSEKINASVVEDFNEENVGPDIHERLAGVNLDDSEQVWDKLNEREKQGFLDFLSNVKLDELNEIGME